MGLTFGDSHVHVRVFEQQATNCTPDCKRSDTKYEDYV